MLTRRDVLLGAIIASIVVNVAVVSVMGMRVGSDTRRYTNGAARLLAGEPMVGKQSSYLGYVGVIAGVQAAGCSLFVVILLQVLIAAVAAAALADLTMTLVDVRAGLIASFLFAINIDIARWNAYILTDSLYISLVTITTWSVERARTGRTGSRILAVILLLVTALARPNGWMLLLVAGTYWIATASWTATKRALAIITLVLVFLLLAVGARGFREGIESETPTRWLQEGVVIWGYDGWIVPMPPSADGEDLAAGLRYATTHPLASVRLALARVGAELIAIRPYYSRSHNIVLLIAYLPLYALSVIGVRHARRPLRGLLLGVIGAHLFTIAITFGSWDGRFLLYSMPLITALAATGATALLPARSTQP